MSLLLSLIYGIVGLVFHPKVSRGEKMYGTSIVPKAVGSRSKVVAIQEVMADGKWRTVNVLREQTPELAGLTDEQVKSRIRDIRNRAGFIVNSKKVHEGPRGLFEYQVLSKGDAETGPFVTKPAASTEDRPSIGSYDNLPADQNIDLDVEVGCGDSIG